MSTAERCKGTSFVNPVNIICSHDSAFFINSWFNPDLTLSYGPISNNAVFGGGAYSRKPQVTH